MHVEQSAGICKITAELGGSPVWSEVEIRWSDERVMTARVATADLHDLRYCIDRILAQIPGGETRR